MLESIAMARRSAGRALGTSTAVAVAIALAHGLNDAYASFLHPLLPRIMRKLDLSISLAAVLTTSLALAASLIQPALGYASDRWGRRGFVVLGPLLSGVFMSLIGAAPSFLVLILFLTLGGLGSAAFHPPGASMAARVGEGAGSGVRLSLFSFGGAAGYAAGPLIAVGMVAAFGIDRLWIAMVPAVLMVPVMFALLPADRSDGAVPVPGPREVMRSLVGPLGLLFGISAISTFVQRVFLTMQPIATAAAGGSEALGAATLSVYLAGQAAGSLLGGYLTDRVDRRKLLVGITLASLPTHLFAIAMPTGSVLALISTAAAGCATMALLPPIIIEAQERMPGGAAIGSGIVMGLAWAVGSVGVLGAGVLGDVWGARAAALVSTPVILAATALAMHPSLAGRRTAAIAQDRSSS